MSRMIRRHAPYATVVVIGVALAYWLQPFGGLPGWVAYPLFFAVILVALKIVEKIATRS